MLSKPSSGNMRNTNIDRGLRTREQKVRAAWILKSYGVPITAIAFALGVHRMTVWRWLRSVTQEQKQRYLKEFQDFRISQF